MLNFVKSLVLITINVLLSFNTLAQLKLPSLSATANDVRKIIEDSPNGFENITGDLIINNEQTSDYECTIKVTGAEGSFVTKYAAKRKVSSWQALMLTTESFDKAKQKFKSLYHQLNNLNVTLGTANYKLKGEYEAPTESLKFASAILSPTPENEGVKKLKIEVALQFNEPMEWTVKLMVYVKEKEDDEKGASSD